MKTIVALVDISDLTFQVLKHVHSIAKAFGSHVILLHVTVKRPVVVDVGLISPTVMEDPSPAVKREEETMLRELRDSLTKFGVESSVREVQAANVEQLLDETRKLNPDLIAVGSHRHGALHQLFLGGIASEVVRRAPCPVVVVPST